MKLFTLAAVAVLFCAVVGGSLLIHLILLIISLWIGTRIKTIYNYYHLKVASASPPFYPTVKNVVSEIVRIFPCVSDGVGKTIGESDLKSEFVQFKQEFYTVLEHDLPKCPELESIDQKYRFAWNLMMCRLDVY